MGNAVQIVLTLLLLMAAGYFLAARGILNEKASKFLSKLVLWIGVPASTVNNMFTSFRADMLQNAGMGILAPFASNLLAFLAAVAVGRLLRVKKGRRGIFYLMFAFSNTIFIGLPVCQALFGDASIPYALFYYMGNTTLVWTIGIYFVQKDNPAQAGGKFSILGTLQKVLSPGIVSFAVSLALVLLGVRLPLFLTKACGYLAATCTPMALLFIGYILWKTGLRNLHFEKDTWGVLLGRILVGPALAYAACAALGAPADMSQVFIVQAAMPAMSNAPILAEAYGSDSAFGAETMAITTLLSLVTMPLLMLLFTVLF